MARDLAYQHRIDPVQTIEIERPVPAVLIDAEATDALLHDVEAGCGKALARPLDQVLDTLRRGLPLAMLAHGLVEFATGVTRPKAKAARLVSTALPPSRIAASKAESGIGSLPE